MARSMLKQVYSQMARSSLVEVEVVLEPQVPELEKLELVLELKQLVLELGPIDMLHQLHSMSTTSK